MIIGQKFEIMLDIINVFWEIWRGVLNTSFFGVFRATLRIKITLDYRPKIQIMLDIIGAFWEIWLDIVLNTSFFGTFTEPLLGSKSHLIIGKKFEIMLDVIGAF